MKCYNGQLMSASECMARLCSYRMIALIKGPLIYKAAIDRHCPKLIYCLDDRCCQMASNVKAIGEGESVPMGQLANANLLLGLG